MVNAMSFRATVLNRIRLANPATKISRFLSSALPEKQPDLRLYQYAICPFCNRVKSVLGYAGVAYETVEVNPLTKAEIKWYVYV
jgi:glutaredoxin